jgi:hypothetical protein
MRSADVAQELWDAVIDIIASESALTGVWYQVASPRQRDALAACTLVCRSWLSRSSQHMFSTLKVSSQEEVLGSIVHSQRITQNVKTLVYSCRSPYRVYDTVQALLSSFPNLECLGFSAVDTYAIDRSPASGVAEHSLKKLRLYGISQTNACGFLRLFHHIDRLSIHRLDADHSSLFGTLNGASLHVRDLRIVWCTDEVVATLRDVLVPDSIQSLSIGRIVCLASELHTFLCSLCQAVTRLTLSIASMVKPADGTLSWLLWHVSALTSASLQSPHCYISWSCYLNWKRCSLLAPRTTYVLLFFLFPEDAQVTDVGTALYP